MTGSLRYFFRALRLPFIAASILPFAFGSLIYRKNFSWANFLLGLGAVICAHLSANLVNDYADSKRGTDWQDVNFYRFFGGSKLIQERVFSEKFYLNTAIIFLLLSWVLVAILAYNLKSALVPLIYALIISLAWAYSQKPLQLSCRGWGELVIFVLFGPTLVMGGYFIQTGIFPSLEGLLLSFPFGFLIAAILFANEIPDFPDDLKSKKFTWVALTGQRNAYLLYDALVFLAFFSIGLNIILGYLKPWAWFSFAFIALSLRAANILKIYSTDKIKLMESSKLTIDLHTWVSIILILGLFP